MNLDELLKKSKQASVTLGATTADVRISALLSIASALDVNRSKILQANKLDLQNAIKAGVSQAMQDRLMLDDKRINGLIEGVKSVAAQNEVVGLELEQYNRPNGLKIVKKSVPFGVVAVIFEARPNVCVDVASLCLKSANACVLKGGKDAFNSNKALVEIMRSAIKGMLDENVITLIEDNSHSVVDELITKREYIDLLLPRGGKGLIQSIVNNAKVPFIETGAGVCNLYIHKDADMDMALDIAVNAKYQRPSVCNAIENIVVDKDIAQKFLPILQKKFAELKIEIRGDEQTQKIIPCKKATEEDFYTEYHDYIVSIKVVDGVGEAISFVNSHSTHHSEAIITSSQEDSEKFMSLIDSACVYHNASTRFSDGGEYGFGAEFGISTQKLHARGPMGIREMTSYKYVVYGAGQVRK